jgi:polysaccharide export outer membrane protein
MMSLCRPWISLVIATFALNACASAGGLPPENAPMPAYRIGPEDLIEVSVWNSDAVSRRVPVRPDGMISLPLVNDVRAAGLTPLELREELVRALQKFIPNPEVSVLVQEINSPKVLVVGEVAHPGRYVIRGPTTVLEIVAQAGGLTEFAAGSRATLVRTLDGRTSRFRIDANEDDASDARAAVHVWPGDIVVVP